MQTLLNLLPVSCFVSAIILALLFLSHGKAPEPKPGLYIEPQDLL